MVIVFMFDNLGNITELLFSLIILNPFYSPSNHMNSTRKSTTTVSGSQNILFVNYRTSTEQTPGRIRASKLHLPRKFSICSIFTTNNG